jgi:hypothetical protein
MMQNVPAELDEAHARQLIERFLSSADIFDGDRWVITKAEEHDWGWAFHWTSERALAHPGELGEQYAGAGIPG